jgi:hypothetical protein
VILQRPAEGVLHPRIRGPIAHLGRQLEVVDGVLRWRDDGREVTELSYLVLGIVRARRYPVASTPVGERARAVETAIERGKLGDAEAELWRLRMAIDADPILGTDEKNLHRAWADFFELRVRAARARLGGRRDAELAEIASQIRTLTALRDRFASILYPAERADIAGRVERLSRNAEATAGGAAGVLSTVRAALAAFRGEPVPAPPAPPAPRLVGFVPRSPSRTLVPTVVGEAAPGTSIRVFLGAVCGGRSAATGPANAAGGFANPVRVARHAKTTLVADAVGPGGVASPCSTPADYVHDERDPDAPGGLEVAESTATRVTLRWVPGSDDITAPARLAYEACVEPDEGRRPACEPFEVRATSSRGARTLTIAGLRPGRRYVVRLRARDEAGNHSKVSAPLRFRLPSRAKRGQ